MHAHSMLGGVLGPAYAPPRLPVQLRCWDTHSIKMLNDGAFQTDGKGWHRFIYALWKVIFIYNIVVSILLLYYRSYSPPSPGYASDYICLRVGWVFFFKSFCTFLMLVSFPYSIPKVGVWWWLTAFLIVYIPSSSYMTLIHGCLFLIP